MRFLYLLIVVMFGSVSVAKEPVKVDFGTLETLQITRDDTLLFEGSVRLADDPVERARGLMFVTEMPADEGMLFDFGEKQTVRMWMKNTKIPLDMIFLGSNGRIATIARNARPESLRTISSGVPVIAVLELNGGMARAIGLLRGDQIHHSMFGNVNQNGEVMVSAAEGSEAKSDAEPAEIGQN